MLKRSSEETESQKETDDTDYNQLTTEFIFKYIARRARRPTVFSRRRYIPKKNTRDGFVADGGSPKTAEILGKSRSLIFPIDKTIGESPIE